MLCVLQVNGVDVASAKHDDVAELIKTAGEFLSLTVISSDDVFNHRHGSLLKRDTKFE